MTTFHIWGNEFVSFTKGALEVLVREDPDELTMQGIRKLARNNVTTAAEDMAGNGLRTLAIAMRKWKYMPGSLDEAAVETGLTLLGVVGMLDPPRKEAAEAVSVCRMAGITPVMITGDHPLTAQIIARRLRILEEGGDVLTGQELERISSEEFESRVEKLQVYARVAPAQKLKIVKALQNKGAYVAMTGDGVNDAPALRRADIGIAMGITGTDVSREAAAMVLLDDNFATIVSAIREGRRIYANILRFITYSITSNAGTLWAISLAPFLGLPLPLLPIQILWLNLLCDSLPGLALTAEKAAHDVMQRPPIDPREGIFACGRGWYMLRHGLLIGLVTLIFQAAAIRAGLPWQTMIFTFLVVSRMTVVLAVRSDRSSLFQIGFFTNRPLVGAILLTFLLQLAVVYVPQLRHFFLTEVLSGRELLIVIGVAGLIQTIGEVEKLIMRTVRANQTPVV